MSAFVASQSLKLDVVSFVYDLHIVSFLLDTPLGVNISLNSENISSLFAVAAENFFPPADNSQLTISYLNAVSSVS